LTLNPVAHVRGTLRMPGDKSLSHRYLMLGAVAQGVTSIAHLAPGTDVAATVQCLRALGASIEAIGPDSVRIRGRAGADFADPAQPLDAMNSGTTMRLLSGLVVGYPVRVTLVGDPSLSRRPMGRVIDPLTAMGARIASDQGRPPLAIEGGPLTAITWSPAVASAQVKSAILLAGLRARGITTVREALRTRDHTERAFPVFGLTLHASGASCSVSGGQHAVAPASPLTVPGDPSSAAVWAAAAAALPGSDVRLEGLCLNPLRLGFIRALTRMGAVVEVDSRGDSAGEPVGALRITHAGHAPTAIEPDEVPDLIDELPVLAARAALGGGLEVRGAAELRVKESDRIAALVSGLRGLGVDAEERPDGFVVRGDRRPSGGIAHAAGDHRLVMAFALVALGSKGPSTIRGADAVAVSYPGFEQHLADLTA
jgi:3-phosphoshikimate 1-carboxyvinyltransferase